MAKNVELEQLVINKLTQAQYDALTVKNPGELYFITDANPTKEVETQLAELSEKVPEPISTYESFPEATAENVGMRVVYTGNTIEAPYMENEDGSVSTVFLDPYLTRGHTFMLVPVQVLTSDTESITIYMWQDVIGAIPPFDYDMAGQVLSTNGMGYEWTELPEAGITKEEADQTYLPLSGGTLTGALQVEGISPSTFDSASILTLVSKSDDGEIYGSYTLGATAEGFSFFGNNLLKCGTILPALRGQTLLGNPGYKWKSVYTTSLNNGEDITIPTEGGTLARLEDIPESTQVEIMPEASADNIEKVLQYIGQTNETYTNGYFYKCLIDASDTFGWQQIDVQPMPNIEDLMGSANGLATLDNNAKVPMSQINDALLGNVQYQGLYDISTNTPNLDTVATKGHYYILSAAGERFGIKFEVGDWIISDGTNWTKVDNTDAVSSVNGRTGNVVITKDDLDLSEYVKNTDYATMTSAGLIRPTSYYSTNVDSQGTIHATPITLEAYPTKNEYSFVAKGTLENIKDDYVKRGLTANTIELTDDEKTAARTWIGAISNTDYAGTDGSPGTFRPSVSYGTQMVVSGYLRAHVDTLEDYKTRGVNFFIGKGTLENIKDDYIKRGLTENALTFTDDEKAKVRTLIGAGSQTDLNNKADDNKVVHLDGSENITGVKTFTLPDNIKFTASKTTGYTPNMTNATNGLTPATNVPWSRNGWHDHFAFGQSFVIYSKEVSTDGETWAADDRDVSYLFAQKEYGNTGELVLAPNAGEMGFRFVLQSANIAYSNIQWIEIGFAYTTAHTVRLLIESSPDGAEWTEVHNSTTGASATNKYLYVGNLSAGNTYLRISVIKTDTAYLDTATRMLYVKGWTTRKGNQGRGIEFEKPYFWDNVPNLMPIKSSGCNLGSVSRKWDAVYATKLNNGADLIIPSQGGTLALQSKAVALTADTVELATNTIYNADELAALTITLPATTDSTYVSQLNFTSGATATAFTAPDTIKWAGDDTDGAFVPMANKRYAVMFYSDNVNIRAIVQGVE